MKQKILKKLKEEGLSLEELMNVKGGVKQNNACTNCETSGDDSCDNSLQC